MRRELVGSLLEPLLGYVAEGYPELFAHPRHRERVEVRELMSLLFRVHQWQPGDAHDPEHPGDPVTRIAAIIGSELN